jgi:Zn-finger nucleic acid-binding protein
METRLPERRHFFTIDDTTNPKYFGIWKQKAQNDNIYARQSIFKKKKKKKKTQMMNGFKVTTINTLKSKS